MTSIFNYKIAISDDNTVMLNDAVEKLIADGFQPFGGISTCIHAGKVHYAQAMVTYDKKPVATVA